MIHTISLSEYICVMGGDKKIHIRTSYVFINLFGVFIASYNYMMNQLVARKLTRSVDTNDFLILNLISPYLYMYIVKYKYT